MSNSSWLSMALLEHGLMEIQRKPGRTPAETMETLVSPIHVPFSKKGANLTAQT